MFLHRLPLLPLCLCLVLRRPEGFFIACHAPLVFSAGVAGRFLHRCRTPHLLSPRWSQKAFQLIQHDLVWLCMYDSSSSSICICCGSLWSARILYKGSSLNRYVIRVTIKSFSIITTDRIFNRRLDLSLLHWSAFVCRIGYLGANASRMECERTDD